LDLEKERKKRASGETFSPGRGIQDWGKKERRNHHSSSGEASPGKGEEKREEGKGPGIK